MADFSEHIWIDPYDGSQTIRPDGIHYVRADHAGTVGRWLIYERNTNPEPTHYTHAELREFARSKGWEENNEKL